MMTTMEFRTDEARWRALCARDRAADGKFFYAVKTTGVFCRPSCAARPAKRENVTFHANAEEAQKAGFRPCLRCHPLASVGQDPATQDMIVMSRYIADHADESLSLDKLAKRAGLSPFHFQRTFKAVLGVTPKQFQTDARMKRLKSNLRGGEGVAGAMFGAGFGSTSRVYEQVDGSLGMTPKAYRAGGKGETLHYATRETALGHLLMAATDRGVCFVQFGDGEKALKDQLAQEYPNAKIEPSAASPALDQWIDALEAHLTAGGPRPELPLDLRGTAFQIRVWRFLLSVKEGDAVSYSEVAKGIGAPKAVRAAASACAKNRIAVLVPCHRVLRGDGALGGYRWGEARKRALLDAERKRRATA